jgi:hypothetical protein
VSREGQLLAVAIINKVVGVFLLAESLKSVSLSDEVLFVGAVFFVFDATYRAPYLLGMMP